MMFSIEISSDIAARDVRTRAMVLHSEASKLETIARGMRAEADLIEADLKKRKEAIMEQVNEEGISPEVYVLAYSGEAMFRLTDVEGFNPWEAGELLTKAERKARILDPRRADPFFFEIDEILERVNGLPFISFTLEESSSFLSKARAFCEKHKPK